MRPGILLNTENTLPKGATSVAPINVPLNAADVRSSSEAPKARARSLASPAPALAAIAPPAIMGAKGATGARSPAGRRAAIEPKP